VNDSHPRSRPVVLGIAGCSGSGRTTLAAELARTLGGLHFPLDHYYLDLGHLPFAERLRLNYDDAALIESSLLAQHVATLARGEPIERPVYDFSAYTRIPGQTQTVLAPRLLIVEGLFTLVYPELRPLCDLRIFVETPDGICFERRLRRDVEERGRTLESVQRQYDETVRPAAERFIRPSAAHADLVLDGAGALDWKVERVVDEMRTRGLLQRLAI
jgi:uridine kinase